MATFRQGDEVTIIATGVTGVIHDTGVGGELFVAGKPYYEVELRRAGDQLVPMPRKCDECRRAMEVREGGVSYHVTDDGQIDHDADADHVAYYDEDAHHDDDDEGDDLCDLCMASGVTADRTTPCGKTIGIGCGCDADNPDGTCNDATCEACKKASRSRE